MGGCAKALRPEHGCCCRSARKPHFDAVETDKVVTRGRGLAEDRQYKLIRTGLQSLFPEAERLELNARRMAKIVSHRLAAQEHPDVSVIRRRGEVQGHVVAAIARYLERQSQVRPVTDRRVHRGGCAPEKLAAVAPLWTEALHVLRNNFACAGMGARQQGLRLDHGAGLGHHLGRCGLRLRFCCQDAER